MKDVIILHHSRGYKDCPYDGEVWVCNNGYDKIDYVKHSISKLFIMHKQVYRKGIIPVFDWEDINAHSIKYNFDVISLHRIEGLNSIRFPFNDIVNKFHTDYFTCTTAYMIAYALYKHYQSIRFYGVDFVGGISEYADDLFERCGVEYWLGRAYEAGSEISIHKSSLLTTTTGLPYAING